ncbi:hypothetical protein CCACVL1_23504 [Corchorus capsularis]|uniref:Uncharacterized protein n=1 Tax=Corchorus capsularis TaxID=210143 RepID=A0A1R3GTR0_COCAP|nr:hypothetical protein CCACVL1_23504 [Corchorus capsularis]
MVGHGGGKTCEATACRQADRKLLRPAGISHTKLPTTSQIM